MAKKLSQKMQRCDHKFFLRSHDQKNNEIFVTINFFTKKPIPKLGEIVRIF